ncbi:MucBP domain-containing protein [Vagococcus entomophilus]|uniref:mucin-binding protein n=1 Tax=Vagococcus entomophilus TaxID=1160095 RepID=UPI001475B919|nr:MucBP domain-containing protein [Vagococcus entomophilus]
MKKKNKSRVITTALAVTSLTGSLLQGPILTYAAERVEKTSQTTGQTTNQTTDSTSGESTSSTTTSTEVSRLNQTSQTSASSEQNVNKLTNTNAVEKAASAVSAQSADTQPLSNLTVNVTADDGTTVMKNGDSYNIKQQSAHLTAIKIGFTLTQDGTLKEGSKIKIPVTITNNSSSLIASALSSGTKLNIDQVGTIEFSTDEMAYIITLDQSFASLETGKKIAATVTEQPSITSALVTKDSAQNIVLTIGNSTFNFVPVHRAYQKDSGDYRTADFAYSPSANQINTGTSIKDPNYINNLLASGGQNAGDTHIPTGNVITIEKIQTSGSNVTQINLGNYLGNSTLQISEDGTYLVKGDNSTDRNFPAGTGVTNIISLPANTSNEDIVKALNTAGKHSGVVINNGDGNYTIAYNFGKLLGEGAYTYKDLYPNDDAATQADKAQEINRTDEINSKVSQVLSSANVIQNLGIQTTFNFADPSVKNELSGQANQYNISDDGVITTVSGNGISSNTTPSNARAEGQSKITVRYVDKTGTDLASQAYQYGYPAGSSIASQSPNYQVTPKSITGYTLISSENQVSSVKGKQMMSDNSLAFLNEDQVVYYVYQVNKEQATVTYMDDTTGKPITSKELSGDYGTTDGYRTSETIKELTDKGYELVKDEYPKDGVTYDQDGSPKTYEVHLKHGTTSTSENKTITETVHYQYSDKSQAHADQQATPVEFSRTVTTDKVDGTKTFGEWSAKDNRTSFAKIASPTIPGYTPDQTEISEVTGLTAESKNIEQTVTYTVNKEQATVTYMDDTTGKPITSKELSGDYGTTDGYRTSDTIKELTDKGYELVKDEYPKDGVTYDKDGSPKTYEVHLKHGTTSTSENKSITETVHYQYSDKSQAHADQQATPVEFSRTVTTDKVDGTKTFGEWSAKDNQTSFAKIASPTIPGYTPDQAEIPEVMGLTAESKNIEQTVTYTVNKEQATVTYMDDTTGKPITSKELSGDYGTTDGYRTSDTIKELTDKGYELVKDEYPKDGVTYDQDGSPKTYEVHLKHGTVTINPASPGQPGAPINPKDPAGPKWAEDTDCAALTKKVTETVHYVYKDGTKAADDQIETVTFEQERTYDKVTGKEIKEDGWKAVQNRTSFGEKISPKLANYTPNQEKVAAINGITLTSKNVEKTVVYSKEATTQATGASNSGQQVAKKAMQPSNASKKSLPQTGEQTQTNFSILGMIVWAISGMFVYFMKGKKGKSKE